jgi:saccharopine dehydrogenase-like NADP-dependent oxidoreductase
VRVASRTLAKAKALVGDHPRGAAQAFDILQEGDRLSDLVAGADLVVSLLPYTYHVRVAEQCVRQGRHLVTTSYVSDGMRRLDAKAREAGVILLNEIGLDPGIDHMSAMRVITRVHEAGGQVKSFRSYCGGLPAPDANDNPLGYKFSWSPRGVILAGRNHAQFKERGAVVQVANDRLFATHFVTAVEGLGDLEAYPNRDSLPYADLYGVPESDTMYRGTLRNLGWCDVMQKLNELGYFSLDERTDLGGTTYARVMAGLVGADGTGDLALAVARSINVAPNSGVMMALAWLGLFSDERVPGRRTLLDVLAERMVDRMPYRPGERDMVVLVHEFEALYEHGHERITSTLIDYGLPDGDSSMARTVGLPAAIGARIVLDGTLRLTGVHIPVLPEIYEPVLDELAQLGIDFEEKVQARDP